MNFQFRENIERLSRDAMLTYIGDLEAKLSELQPDATTAAAGYLAKAFRLTPKEAAVLLALSDGRPHSKDGILTMVYGGLDEPMVKIVDVFICKLRRKLTGSGIEIGTLWGQGYVVEDTAPLLAVMRGEKPLNGQPTAPLTDGRSRGDEARPLGSMRDAALAFIRKQAVAGKARFPSKALEIAIEHRTAGSTMVRNLEKGGHLTVLKAPRRTGRSPVVSEWVVKLT